MSIGRHTGLIWFMVWKDYSLMGQHKPAFFPGAHIVCFMNLGWINTSKLIKALVSFPGRLSSRVPSMQQGLYLFSCQLVMTSQRTLFFNSKITSLSLLWVNLGAWSMANLSHVGSDDGFNRNCSDAKTMVLIWCNTSVCIYL